MSLQLLSILLIQLSIHTLGCSQDKADTATCVEAAILPTEANGGIFVDNTPQIAAGGILGYDIEVESFTSGNTVNNQVSVEKSSGPGVQDVFFIGPFNGNGMTNITRDFACSKDSTASLVFEYYQCGTIDGDDKATGVDTLDYGLRIPGDASDIRSVSGIVDGSQELMVQPTILMTRGNECTPWRVGVVGLTVPGSPIELDVKADETFQVVFEMDYSARDEWAAFSNVMVTCTAKDSDGDGVANTDDNCPDVANQDQNDLDKDKIGDACDPDKDEDGVDELDASGEALDNCPNVANEDQADMDGDGIGDACDSDKDGDGVNEFDASGKALDNCPDKYNPYQKDRDHDGKGDKCDYDIDDDGVPNKFDDCPYTKGPIYNKGCPDYGRGGRDDGRGRNDYGGNRGRGREDGYGRVDPRDDTGRGRRAGSYSYSGSYSSSSGRGRGRRGSFSGSYSSSSGNSRNGRSGRGYVGSDDYKGGRGGSYKGDERQQLEEMLRQMEEQYRGSSKY